MPVKSRAIRACCVTVGFQLLMYQMGGLQLEHTLILTLTPNEKHVWEAVVLAYVF